MTPGPLSCSALVFCTAPFYHSASCAGHFFIGKNALPVLQCPSREDREFILVSLGLERITGICWVLIKIVEWEQKREEQGGRNRKQARRKCRPHLTKVVWG